MSLRYWLCGLSGVALCATAVVAVTLGTFGLTSQSLCAPGSDQLACELSSGQLSLLIGVSLLLVIPVGGWVFAARKPGGGAIGGLAIALAFSGAAAAALVVGIDNAGTSAEAPGLIAGAVLAAIAPILLIATLIGTFSNLDGDLTARARAIKRGGGAGAGERGPAPAVGVSGGTGAGAQTASFGDLAAQLAQIAAARSRAAGDGTTAKLRQLDELRASGLLTPEEHERKRRELLDSL